METMEISDFQKKFKHHINHNLSFLWLSRLSDIAELDLDVYLPTKDKNLQRGLVWTLLQKQALIFTILRDHKIPPFVVIEDEKERGKKYKWQVIDGKQRISTIFQFFNNEFSITHKGVEYFYKDLPTDCKKQIDSYDSWTVTVHYSYKGEEITDQTKIDIFEDINFLGTPQDIEHLNSLKQ
jgi:uncharacterized protein with ParB-like and HNH nuclease domain